MRVIDPREQHARRLAGASVFKPSEPPLWNINEGAHLSRSEVAYIRRRLLIPRWGLQSELADEFGVTRSAISRIATGRTHRSVAP